jgi:hypothetical protein
MRKFERNEIGIGFTNSASESEYKAAEEVIRKYFGSRLERCFRDGYWVVAKVSGLSASDRAAFIKAVNSNKMPNVQAVGPSS